MGIQSGTPVLALADPAAPRQRKLSKTLPLIPPWTKFPNRLYNRGVVLKKEV
jgi:hypothetical protein